MKRSIVRSIVKRDSKHASSPVLTYLQRASLCNTLVSIAITDGSLVMRVSNGQVVPYVPTSQTFAIWFGVSPSTSEEPIADIKFNCNIKSLIKKWSTA